MQSSIMKDITSYIDFLRECGFSLTLSCFSEVLRPCYETLLQYEPHLCRICARLKSSPKTRDKCISNKDRLNRKNPRENIYFCCWAGVEEFVLPVLQDGELVCCINLSGYRGRLEISKKLSEKLKRRLGAEYADNYEELSTSVPKQNEIERIINPLKYMLRSLYRHCLLTPAEDESASEIYISTLRYIYDHYMERISAQDIASALNYSPSHLRHVFLKKGGKTISDTLTSVRLSAAEQLLSQSELSVTRVALDCGFCDGNYFSTVFKKHKGVSPKEYRTALRSKKGG